MTIYEMQDGRSEVYSSVIMNGKKEKMAVVPDLGQKGMCHRQEPWPR
jgi:hypothetical protein